MFQGILKEQLLWDVFSNLLYLSNNQEQIHARGCRWQLVPSSCIPEETKGAKPRKKHFNIIFTVRKWLMAYDLMCKILAFWTVCFFAFKS